MGNLKKKKMCVWGGGGGWGHPVWSLPEPRHEKRDTNDIFFKTEILMPPDCYHCEKHSAKKLELNLFFFFADLLDSFTQAIYYIFKCLTLDWPPRKTMWVWSLASLFLVRGRICVCVCVHTGSVFPTEHSLRTRTQVRHECTQVHGEKRSSNLQKSISVPIGADKPLIFHSKKRYTRAKSPILSRRKPFACMRSLLRHGLLGGFSVKLIFILNFLKEAHGPRKSLLHSPTMPKDRYRRKNATNLMERWMIRCEGMWSNYQCPQLVRCAFFEVAKFWDSFSFQKKTM